MADVILESESRTGADARRVAAVFDFDGTLTRRDTLLPFLLHALGAATVMRHAMALASTLTGYGLGLIPNAIAKERVLVRCLAGMPADDLQQLAVSFAESTLPGLMRFEALRRLGWHRDRGHRCIVVSASLDVYVRPWALGNGFDDVIATQLERSEGGLVTGRLAGANCFGLEKVRRLAELLGNTKSYTLYAYGDSRGDRELLESADHAYYRHFPRD
jgi:phosphatidylglycerophosphatase C